MTNRVEGYGSEFQFGRYSLCIFVFMEVTEFRLQSKLGRAHSHERIYLGRLVRDSGEGEEVGFPTHPYEEGRM
jgi:hypothetical protein